VSAPTTTGPVARGKSVPALPNFLPEDFLALLRAAVGLAWIEITGMAALKIGFHLAGLPWPQLGGFATTYAAVLAEFALTAAALSVLVVRRDWFERVPRAASLKLRTLLTLVVVWLCVHHLFAFHLLGGWRGPLLPLLPLLVLVVFLALPRSGAWAVATLLLAGHGAVVLLEYNRWIQSPGMFAPVFQLDSLPGLAAFALAPALALAIGALARRRLDQAGANVNRGNRVNPLTGLYEQEFLLQRLDSELQRQRRHGGTLTLMMIEFDGFAAYTAAYGYDAGRLALHHAARVLIQTTRHDMDTPARYAPTTFALLLPDAAQDQAAEIAQRIRGSMAEVSQGALHPKAGMACVSNAGDLSGRAVLAAAGQALRHAPADGAPARVDLPYHKPQDDSRPVAPS
jgi:diguanylate cyclase (GGDEF)-like protein